MDLMLSLIAMDQGVELTDGVANQFHLDRIRSQKDPQRSGAVTNLGNAPPALMRAVEIMLGAIETPVPIPTIARAIGLTSRQLERLCLKHLGKTPVRYYLGLRTERARELLIHTAMPILDVAMATGFPSSSYFSQAYRAHFGKTPSEARKNDHA
jgi:transcriptional regulator GlxA family with amidase domain